MVDVIRGRQRRHENEKQGKERRRHLNAKCDDVSREKGVTRGTATGPGQGLFCWRRIVEQVDRFSFAGARLAG
jgi:hypothetical protein